MSFALRQPRFGGVFGFYPDNPSTIQHFIQSVSNIPVQQFEGKGIMVPHAGYQYSGKTLYRTLKSLKTIPETMIIIGPNHTGIGNDVSIMTEGTWNILNQNIFIQSEIAEKIEKKSNIIQNDNIAHQKEHSIEVILPLLLSIQPKFRLIPIIMRNYHPSVINDVSEAIISALQSFSDPVLVIASTDMSHYVSQLEAHQKDQFAFEAIQKMDSQRLLHSVQLHHISMCGSGPVAVAMNVSIYLGATIASMIDYTDSSEETKDTSEVVAYAGFVFH